MVFQSRLEQSLLAFVTTLYIKKAVCLWNLMKFQDQLKFYSKFSRWISKISESKCERSSCIEKLFGLKVCLQRNSYILFVCRGLCFSVLYRTSADNYGVSVVQYFFLELDENTRRLHLYLLVCLCARSSCEVAHKVENKCKSCDIIK